MVEFVLDALSAAGVRRMLVVVGYRAEDVRRALAGRPGVEFVEQREQLGTGHAVMVCRSALDHVDGPVLVVTGDSPLIQTTSLRRLLDEFHRDQPACLLGTAFRDEPGNLGRVVRDEAGEFLRIVEVKDADAVQRQIREVNMSTYVFDGRQLLHALDRVRNTNAQGEYYITDVPGILRAEGRVVRALAVLQPCEALSINNRQDLAAVEGVMKQMGYSDTSQSQ
jgi:bifunctional UDP-N-acetylglucosamine pyrophosphorylase/glucosamine-1-phosphate N-acetyltransferase/UDP-N-acetylglucosamine pyrophosphorylase